MSFWSRFEIPGSSRCYARQMMLKDINTKIKLSWLLLYLMKTWTCLSTSWSLRLRRFGKSSLKKSKTTFQTVLQTILRKIQVTRKFYQEFIQGIRQGMKSVGTEPFVLFRAINRSKWLLMNHQIFNTFETITALEKLPNWIRLYMLMPWKVALNINKKDHKFYSHLFQNEFDYYTKEIRI